LAKIKLDAVDTAIAVYVIPLLVETKSQLPFDLVVTVEAPMDDQIERMVESRSMTRSEAISRISAQATPAERANVADRILNSNQSLSLLLDDARKLFYEISELASKTNVQGQ
jgi:dephospho-CoA kinase